MPIGEYGYDLRSQVKNKTNSQGTLFRAGAGFRTPESRQPRGFSPERRAEVNSNLQEVETLDPKDTPRVRANLINNLARSTIPAADIKNAEYWGANSERLAAQGKRGKTNGGEIEIAPGSESTPTAIHELGHAVSFATNAAHRSQFSGLTQKGAEEGFADNYLYKHFRAPGYKRSALPDGVDKIRDRSTRWSGVYKSAGTQADFQKGYLSMRLLGPAPVKDQYKDKDGKVVNFSQGKLF